MNYYVYMHSRVDTKTPFYIGKGTNNPKLTLYHRAYSKKRRNKTWYQITKEVDFFVTIVYSTDDEKKAFEKERELIMLYGRICLNTGSLCNIGAGGGGGTSIPHNPEWSKKRFKACHRYDLNGKYVDSYKSRNLAARVLQLDPSSITACAKGRQKTLKNHYWRYYKTNQLQLTK